MKEKSRIVLLLLVIVSLPISLQAAVMTLHTTAPTPGGFDIYNFVGTDSDIDNVGEGTTGVYDNDGVTYVAHDRGGQGQTFVTSGSRAEYMLTGVWVQHVGYTTAADTTWYRMQPGGRLQIRITDPAASGTNNFVLSSEIYEITGQENNALPEETTNDATGTGLWFHVTLDTPIVLAPNTEYGFDLTSLSGLEGVMFFETRGIRDDAAGGNPYTDGSAYVTGSDGTADNILTSAPGDRVFVVELDFTSNAAGAPYPADEAMDVSRDVILRWMSGPFADKHNVYLGTSFDEVDQADSGSPLLVGPDLVESTYTPERLEFSQKYFWRVDEVNAPPDSTVFKGDIWSFTIESFAIPISGENIVATASSQEGGERPENTVNSSGLDANDLHSQDTTAMWLTSEGGIWTGLDSV